MSKTYISGGPASVQLEARREVKVRKLSLRR